MSTREPPARKYHPKNESEIHHELTFSFLRLSGTTLLTGPDTSAFRHFFLGPIAAEDERLGFYCGAMKKETQFRRFVARACDMCDIDVLARK
jgi:hypothetical protein